MHAQLRGRVRKIMEAIDISKGGDDEELVINGQRELLVAQGSTQYGETVRAGHAFWTGPTTPVAAVVAVPTTAAMFAIFNNDVDGGRSAIIDWISWLLTTGTAAAGQGTLLCNIGQVREAAPTDSGMTIKKLNGLGASGVDSKIRSILTATALPATTGVAANWFPLGAGAAKPGAAATPGAGGYVDVNGRIIVPPGRYFAVHVLADVVGSLYLPAIGWHEKQLDLA